MDESQDAVDRTDLANERTQLAWWRTGLTTLAVGLAIGRVLPGLGDTTHRVPSQDDALIGLTVVGVVLAALTTVLILVD